MRILAFDLGRTTGFALLEGDDLKTGWFRADGDDEAQVFISWSEWARDTIEAWQPDAIAFEDVTFNRGRSYIPGMKALLFVHASRHDLTCFGVPVQTLKRFAKQWYGGDDTKSKWLSGKMDMKAALANKLTPERVLAMTEDEVDAAWAAIWFNETATETPEDAA